MFCCQALQSLSKSFGRSLSVNLCRSCPHVERGNVFSKARKQNKEVAGCRVCREFVYGSGRSAADADPAEKVTRKDNELIVSLSSNAKTHRRCAADLSPSGCGPRPVAVSVSQMLKKYSQRLNIFMLKKLTIVDT